MAPLSRGKGPLPLPYLHYNDDDDDSYRFRLAKWNKEVQNFIALDRHQCNLKLKDRKL